MIRIPKTKRRDIRIKALEKTEDWEKDDTELVKKVLKSKRLSLHNSQLSLMQNWKRWA
jgi:hypothetical protein